MTDQQLGSAFKVQILNRSRRSNFNVTNPKETNTFTDCSDFVSKNLEVSPKNLHHSDNAGNTGCL